MDKNQKNFRVRYFVKKSVKVAIWQHHNTHAHLEIEVLPSTLSYHDITYLE